VKNERDRIVVALRRLADRVATAVETLVRTVERALGREK
jgi:hypothetical protein